MNASDREAQEQQRKEKEAQKKLEEEKKAQEEERRRQEKHEQWEQEKRQQKLEGERLYREAMKSFGTEKSASMLQKAASYGNVNAHYQLGIAYIEGKGVGYSPSKAIEHFRTAAWSNHAKAQYVLGVYYSEEFEATRDNTQLFYAYILLEAASRNGIKEAGPKAAKAKALMQRDTGDERKNLQLRNLWNASEFKINQLMKPKTWMFDKF